MMEQKKTLLRLNREHGAPLSDFSTPGCCLRRWALGLAGGPIGPGLAHPVQVRRSAPFACIWVSIGRGRLGELGRERGGGRAKTRSKRAHQADTERTIHPATDTTTTASTMYHARCVWGEHTPQPVTGHLLLLHLEHLLALSFVL